MKVKLVLLTLLSFVSGSLTSAAGADDYEQHIRRFASNNPPEQARTAVQTLRKAGTNAFPALLAHLNDKALAERNTFQRASMRVPTIGDACFDLLQGQIEGAWPKDYRAYHVLSSETVRDWLALHQGLSLRQLRIEAAQESLKRAEAETPKAAKSDFHKRALEFLRKHLEETKQNAANAS